ncbi:MAG TPA: type II toxin-antitoxin system VapC family toxin [Thermoplasmata archaeon]|nr:type II toxin-antitoxin system VapC family toxin [Thermoplasmata archaeon]
MRSLDASFCFDLLRGDPGAIARVPDWESQNEQLTIAAPALAEFLRAGYHRRGRILERSLELARRLEVLPLDSESAEEAARMGGELDRQGTAVGNLDLLIAAIVRRHHGVLVTRDSDFHRIPGLHLETY